MTALKFRNTLQDVEPGRFTLSLINFKLCSGSAIFAFFARNAEIYLSTWFMPDTDLRITVKFM